MTNNSKKVIIIGTGNMACTYYRHLESLGCKCFMSFRNINSQNTINAKKTFGKHSIISQEESLQIEPDIVLSCTDVKSHLMSLLPFADSKNCFLLSEKPISFSIKDMRNYSRRDIYTLMNRRYYSWVENVRTFARSGKIKKIVINLPERSSYENFDGVPKLILENSIHVFDLVNYIAGNFSKASYVSEMEKSKLIVTNTKKVKEIFFNINFDSIERFCIKFYFKDNSVIVAEPIEKALHYKSFKIIEPSVENYVTSYIPYSEEINPCFNRIKYQKTGILELCEDLIKVESIKKTKLPNIDEMISLVEWLIINWNK